MAHVADCPTRDASRKRELQVSCLPPGAGWLSPFNWKRLFRGQPLTRTRLHHLFESSVILIACNDEVLALAAYRRADGDVRVVHEFVLDPDAVCRLPRVVDAVLGQLEASCRVDGCRYLIVITAGTASDLLTVRGYVPISQDGVDAWLEKRLGGCRPYGSIH